MKTTLKTDITIAAICEGFTSERRDFHNRKFEHLIWYCLAGRLDLFATS